MKLIKPLKGYIRAKITSADIPGFLKAATDHEILLLDMVSCDDLSVYVTVTGKVYKKLQRIASDRGDRCTPAKKWGFAWTVMHMKDRMILLMGILVFAALTVFVPSRILFFQVSGNETVPQRWILEKAEQDGLTFGCKRADINSDKTKNFLLLQIPELDWVGVTTAGCVVTIEVKEKPLVEQTEEQEYSVGHIVASCDGVVEHITVVNGIPLCKPGQVVQSGQILISGYEDCGIVIKASRAKGEVYAKTYHTFQMVTPVFEVSRSEKIRSKTKYSIQIGKNLINFEKDSGISPSGCVKMYDRKYLTLPGGFQLPVALVREEQVDYETGSADPVSEDYSWLEETADQYILRHMSAGEILSSQTAVAQTDELWLLSGAYACREQIGENRTEEILKPNGKNS